MSRALLLSFATLCLLASPSPGASVAWAQPAEAPPSPAPPSGPQPFGANLFTGTYAAHREDGLNAGYEILPGDRVMVNAWGAVTINDVFAVDTQGNLFLPGIGPVHVGGVPNGQLTATVQTAIRRVYRGAFGVYTNLLTASPVAVFVAGNVVRPGRYAGIPSDSVLFFLDQAGGIDPAGGSFRRVQVVRQGSPVAEIDLYEFIRFGRMPPVQFEDDDTIVVGRRGPTVEVHQAGGEEVLVELGADATGESLLEIVPFGPRVNTVTVSGMRDGELTAESLTPEQLRASPMRDGDRVVFVEDRRAGTIIVHLEGEFQGPSELAVRRGARLLDVLNHVPVDPSVAQTDAVFVRRDSVREEQTRALRESLERLRRNTMLALSDTNTESQIRVREAEMINTFIERAREIRPEGRVVTTSAGRQLNVLLEDGDVVVIPTRTNVVRVVGEVQIPHAVQFRPDLRVPDYVRMAGGYSNRADSGHVIVRRPNAEILIGGNDTPIHPGDEILITPAIDDKWAQNGIDLAQVIYQIAVAASVVLRPF